MGFSTKRCTCPYSSITTTPYLEGSSTCIQTTTTLWPPTQLHYVAGSTGSRAQLAHLAAAVLRTAVTWHRAAPAAAPLQSHAQPQPMCLHHWRLHPLHWLLLHTRPLQCARFPAAHSAGSKHCVSFSPHLGNQDGGLRLACQVEVQHVLHGVRANHVTVEHEEGLAGAVVQQVARQR